MDFNDAASFFAVDRQRDRHLNTLSTRDRYAVDTTAVDDITMEEITEDGLLYETDGTTAAVAGDLKTVAAGTVENAAAFLDTEFGDTLFIGGHQFTDGEDRYGFVAAYYDPDRPQVMTRQSGYEVHAPTAIVNVFEPVATGDQIDVYVERFGDTPYETREA